MSAKVESVDVDVQPAPGSEQSGAYFVEIGDHFRVMSESDLRALLSAGMQALGHDGTKPWMAGGDDAN